MVVRSCKEYRETPSPSSAEPPAALSGTSLELMLRLPDAVSWRRLSLLRGGCGARVGLRACRGTAGCGADQLGHLKQDGEVPARSSRAALWPTWRACAVMKPFTHPSMWRRPVG